MPMRTLVLILAVLPAITVALLGRRRHNPLSRWLHGPRVEIEAGLDGLLIRLDDQPQSIAWRDVEELRLGPFPWWSTVILGQSGQTLAVIAVGPQDPLASGEEKRSTLAGLLVSNNPGTFIGDPRTLGRVRLHRAG